MKNQKKILLVDNNMEFRLFMKIRLEMSKYEIYEARSGLEGYNMACNIKPNLILMDFSLHDQNGFELTKKIRSNPSIANIPIILISSFPLGSVNDNTILDLKIDAHIINPYEIELLFEKIRVFFQEEESSSNTGRSTFIERRDEFRFTTFNFASVEIAKGKKLARIKNISRKGVSLMLKEEVKKGDSLKIIFRKQCDEFTGLGKIKWIQREDTHGAVLIGAEIESLVN